MSVGRYDSTPDLVNSYQYPAAFHFKALVQILLIKETFYLMRTIFAGLIIDQLYVTMPKKTLRVLRGIYNSAMDGR